jgi:hypothetical protein
MLPSQTRVISKEEAIIKTLENNYGIQDFTKFGRNCR